ncbi:hypothetical protein ARC78_12530 [Stenotrophomonas pictorum JCM 9942]|uniref:Uncharacterized protein n=1 Tax=Stenotrophomonas pictorum JCM 9942 TaxID=1236960 RepID=A0A0R0A5Y4_9GAMM|nr:hypothetical protein [Stenotrophomonas pictorum]KRG40534.1 hypothetical protein ARC78_12530 [Stenotrophomonas pictorum JCM 9942]
MACLPETPMQLHLEHDPIRLRPGHGEDVCLPLSLTALLADGLQRFPPSEAALERAIARTEDALMPQIPALRAHLHLQLDCADAVLAPLTGLLVLPAQARPVLQIEQVEHAFNLLARVAAGMPARSVGLPEQPGFVAALVVVRELMHHVGWRQLRLGDPAHD